jgi:hypothetical protein
MDRFSGPQIAEHHASHRLIFFNARKKGNASAHPISLDSGLITQTQVKNGRRTFCLKSVKKKPEEYRSKNPLSNRSIQTNFRSVPAFPNFQ